MHTHMEEGSETEIPCYFLCPISMQLIKDPVTVSTGITYDRENIEKWLFSCRKTFCPVTKVELRNTDITENHTLRRLIQSWCSRNEEALEASDQMGSQGLEEERFLSDGGISGPIIQALESGNCRARAQAIEVLKSSIHRADREQLIGSKPEVFYQIVHILRDRISAQATKTALKLLLELIPWGRNRAKAVESGAGSALIDLLLDSEERKPCELVLACLDQLCSCAEGRAELLRHGAGLAVVSKKILRVSNLGSEMALRVICSIARHCGHPWVRSEMIQVGVVSKLCLVLQVNSSLKSKEKAKEILRMYSGVWRASSCIPPHLLSSYPAS